MWWPSPVDHDACALSNKKSVPLLLTFAEGWLPLKAKTRHMTLLQFDALPHACKLYLQSSKFITIHYY
jgi:hypothetical protein